MLLDRLRRRRQDRLTGLDVLVLVAALASTWAMTGVIWVIQLVHYPIFDAVEQGTDGERWRSFGARHRRTISFVVGPFMAVEGLTGIWIVIHPPGASGRVLPLVAAVLMAAAYGVTAFVSVPLHERLTQVFDHDAHRRLVSTNWLRTVAWTARGVVVAALAVVAIPV